MKRDECIESLHAQLREAQREFEAIRKEQTAIPEEGGASAMISVPAGHAAKVHSNAEKQQRLRRRIAEVLEMHPETELEDCG